ncbi:MAG: GAF domain-containing protein [Cyclobacteriaceae bacterium]|nr:GAF domain-containing protein [Cyclobacteriaceae bacterium]
MKNHTVADLKKGMRFMERFKSESFFAFIFFIMVFSGLLYSFLVNHYASKKLQDSHHLFTNVAAFEKSANLIRESLLSSQLHLSQYWIHGKEIQRLKAIAVFDKAGQGIQELYGHALVLSALYDATDDILQIAESFTSMQTSPAAEDEKEEENEEELATIKPVIQKSEDITMEAAQIAGIERSLFEISVKLGLALEKRRNTDTKQLLPSFFNMYFALAVFMFLLYILWRFRYYLREKIDSSASVLRSLSEGMLPEKRKIQDELFGELDVQSNGIIDYLSASSHFTSEIGEGKFEIDFKPRSEEDVLGNALIQMRDKLKKISEEDKIRNWTNEGQAMFADLIRRSIDNLENMGDKVLATLVEYVHASQAALYMFKSEEDGEEWLEMFACYAYGRKKHLNQRIQPGEGLAGEVYLENKPKLIKAVPEGHFMISSGLGSSKASEVYIVPVSAEGKNEGVMVLAKSGQFKTHELTFIDRLAETLASSIRTAHINDTTRALLAETRQRAEEMKAQEEELRQNMEELAATQEQMHRKNSEVEAMLKDASKRQQEIEDYKTMLLDILNELPQKIFLKDQEGKIFMANQKVAENHNMSIEELIGKSDFDFTDKDTAESWRRQELEILKKGEETYVFEEKIGGKTRILESIKKAFFIKPLKQTGLLGIQTDVTPGKPS